MDENMKKYDFDDWHYISASLLFDNLKDLMYALSIVYTC